MSNPDIQEQICPYCWCSNNIGEICDFEDMTINQAREILIGEIIRDSSWSIPRLESLQSEISGLIRWLNNANKYFATKDALIETRKRLDAVVQREKEGGK